MQCCTITVENAEFDPPGVYECKSLVNDKLPVYKFDSEDERTIIHLGLSNQSYCEFYDLNSNKTVKLYEDSTRYDCKCIEEFKK